MANRKISQLTALTTPAAGDYLPIVDISEAADADKNKRITIEELLRGAPDGTAAAPSIAFESDSDSGLYRTGANGLALATGGTGRLFVDSTGRVGIGKAVPTSTFDIYGATTASLYLQNSSTGTTTNDGTSIALTGSDLFFNHREAGNVRFYVNGAERFRLDTNGQLSHFGAGSAGSPAVSFNGSAPSSSLVIDSTGKVGLGTSSPERNLHIAAATPIFRLDNTSTGGISWDMFTGTNTNNSVPDGTFVLRNADAGSNYFAVNSSGNVGIGTTSPSTKLHVEDGNNTVVTLGNTSYDNGVVQYFNGSLLLKAAASTGDKTFQVYTAGSERLRITSTGELKHIGGGTEGSPAVYFGGSAPSNSLYVQATTGNVGLGTNNPTHDLTIGSTAPSDFALALRGGVGGFLGWDDSANCTILQAPNTRSLQFRVNSDTFSAGTMAMHINSSGNVGIGTTTPDALLTVNGVGAHGLGSAAAPSFAFTGDLNTGIYSPGADQIAISTGGTGRLFIDGSGNVGVGTANPSVPLQINTAYSGTQSLLRLIGENATANNAVGIQFGPANGVVGAAIYGFAESDFSTTANRDGALTFHTRLDGGGIDERLRITSTGQIQANSLGSAAAPILSFTTDTNTGIYSPGADQVAISTNGTGRLFIDSNGRVGVGTTPLTVLHVNGDIRAENSRFLSGRGTALAPAYRFHDDGDSGLWSPGTNEVALSTGGSERLRITSDGKVGLGTSSPTERLHVSGKLLLNNGTNSYFDAASTNGLVITNPTAVRFEVGSERLRIDSSGNVGIGTTSPDGLVHLRGDTNSNGAELFLQVDNNNTTDILGSIHFGNNVDRTLSSIQGGTLGANTTSYLTFSTSSSGAISERARIDSSGRLLVGTSTWSSDHGVVVAKSGSNSGGSLFVGKYDGSMISGDFAGQIAFGSSFDGNLGALIKSEADANWTHGTSHPGRLVFSTTAAGASSPTEHVRINAAGAFKASLAGTYESSTSSYHELRTNASGDWIAYFTQTTTSNPNGVLIKYTGAAPNNTGNTFLYCEDNTAVRATIRSNGGIANFSANDVNLSDINAKKDITLAAGTWDCLKEWEIVNFRYKEQPDDADLNLGVIAQQVAESCPEVITVFQEATDDHPEKLGVKEQQMMWMAIKALQEAQTRIETLEAEVAALKGA